MNDDGEPRENPILWIDLETTGLDPEIHSIIEVSMVVTNGRGERPFEIVDGIVSPTERVSPPVKWSEKARRMHDESGLLEDLDEIKKSLDDDPLCIADVGQNAAVKVAALCDGKPRLGGTGPHFDRSFLEVHAPSLASELSHRHFDVRTLWCALRDASGEEPPAITETHRASDDVGNAIEFWRDEILPRLGDPGRT